jgi:signal peptidase I
MEPRPWHKIWIIALVIFIVADVYMIAGSRSKNTIGLRAFRVITNSMAPTLQAGDLFLLDTNYYKNNEIKRGNVISFHRAGYSGPLCKRVIGIPGDRIEGRGNTVVVNDSLLDEPYARYIGRNAVLDDFNRQHQTSDFGPVFVPDGQLFVMGDNRDNSYDSRDPEFGFVPVERVWAKPLYIYFSTTRSRIGKTIR